jgi:hypothetical protein
MVEIQLSFGKIPNTLQSFYKQMEKMKTFSHYTFLLPIPKSSIFVVIVSTNNHFYNSMEALRW